MFIEKSAVPAALALIGKLTKRNLPAPKGSKLLEKAPNSSMRPLVSVFPF